MNQLASRKTVLVGVTGCIAAYKACEIVRGLQKAGVRAKVVMTDHATEFVGPVTFRSLTREPVAVGLFDDAPGDPIHHISLAQECDLMLIAPATANCIAKLAHGLADDLLTTTALATKAPILIAPAMNVNMYENPITQENINRLKERGVHFVDPGEGYLACGDEGKGRLADVDVIVERALALLEGQRDLAGKTVLITAGPTAEPIDAVRVITNHSSGKTGYALAEAAAARGAMVHLISGPVAIDAPDDVEVHAVNTACEMLDASMALVDAADVVVCTAAVADMRPAHPSERKLKKGADDASLQTIELVKNPDILATLATQDGQRVVVGFAAETKNVIEYAQEKLKTKGADLIVANLVGQGRAFGTKDNELWLVTSEHVEHVPLADKRYLADVVLNKTLELYSLKYD